MHNYAVHMFLQTLRMDRETGHYILGPIISSIFTCLLANEVLTNVVPKCGETKVLSLKCLITSSYLLHVYLCQSLCFICINSFNPTITLRD